MDRFRRTEVELGPTIRFDNAPFLLLYVHSLPDDVNHIAFDPNSDKAITIEIEQLHKNFKILEHYGNL